MSANSINMLKFQVISDVHLEMRGYMVEFPITAPYLILAGDIGRPESALYQQFLEYQADRYDKVFLVNGNHDHYGRTREQTEELVAKICKTRSNLVFLNRTSYDLDEDHVMLGCVLWSEMQDEQRSDLYLHMADLTAIQDWSFEQNNWQHKQEKAWLQEAVREVEADGKLAIVVTHHSPSFRRTVAPEYVGNEIASGFCTNLEDLLKLPVVCYVHGHTHFSGDQVFHGECRLVSNQLGNISEQTGFDPEFCVEIE